MSYDITVHRKKYATPPAHHLTSGNNDKKPGSVISGARFKNPWPSWYRPSAGDLWKALEWGDDRDGCIDLAARRVHDGQKRAGGDLSMKEKADRLVKVVKPDADFGLEPTNDDPDPDPDQESGRRQRQKRASVTWLGHAGMLVQLRRYTTTAATRPIRILFDPIFSLRCSPTQQTGPIRTYPAPCQARDLPAIDFYCVSHNHYDHLDLESVKAVWKHHQDTVRFCVPLGLAAWFVDCGIPSDRVTELDWWDHVDVMLPPQGAVTETTASEVSESVELLRISCTPSQHNSGGRTGGANATLWSSWYVELSVSVSSPTDEQPKPTNSYRIFFAGDTGYQFHDSANWPPAFPKSSHTIDKTENDMTNLAQNLDINDPTINGTAPCCPAFEQIAQTLGPPDVLLLPIAVGATFDYIRSWTMLPDSLSPFPRHRAGLTAANHMPPWDAVRVFRLMIRQHHGQKDHQKDHGQKDHRQKPIAIAMHWGTFVPNPTEVLKTLGHLEWACNQHQVRFARDLSPSPSLPVSVDDHDDEENDGKPIFLALNHGQSVTLS